MARRGRIPDRIRQEVDVLLADFVPFSEIAAKFDVSESWVRQHAGKRGGKIVSSNGNTYAEVKREAKDFPLPLAHDELRPEAKRALEDIEFFAARYFGIVLQPWQVNAKDRILALLDTPYEEYAVINVAPGSGKTVFFTRILPCWLTCRDRAMRGMVGSATNKVATRILDQLRKDFVRPNPERMGEKDFRKGLVQPGGVLAADYGRFRPDVEGAIWTREQFEVAQVGDTHAVNKEPTWAAFGVDSTFIGWRVDFAIWDDLWDPRKARSADTREQVYSWFDEVAETRLEPGGLFLLQGQRLAPDDIYAYALAKTDELDEWEQIDEPGFEVVAQRKKYHHITYKALDEEKLTGDPAKDELLLRPDAPAWPDGPLLSPRRITWKRLRQVRSNSPDQFKLVYQQEDSDLEETLVNPLWIDGGIGKDGEVFPGCWDRGRPMWTVPEGLAQPVVSVLMADPSPTQYWGIHWWLFQPGDGATTPDLRHVIALEERKMQANEFLDWHSSIGTWSGLLEDWYQASKERGFPLQYVIVETNVAQRFLLQYEHVRKWQQSRGVSIVSHQTTSRKNDPDYGVQMLSPLYRHGRVRLPYDAGYQSGMGANNMVYRFKEQLTKYPKAQRDDLVMSSWFLESKLDVIRPRRGKVTRLARPAFMREMTGTAA
jgi:hypothetical protein